MKKARNYVATMWQPAVATFIGCFVLFSLLTFGLNKLVPGYAAQEVAARQSSLTLTAIIHDPSYLPHKALQLVIGILRPESAALYRLISGLIAAFSTVIFYLLVKKWFGAYVAILATLMYFTSSWFLSISRLATPTIMLALLPTLIYLGQRLRNTQKAWPWIIAVLAVCVALYIPGFVWFIIAGTIWQFRRLRQTFERLKSSTIIICSAIAVLSVVPMVVATFYSRDFIFAILGLPKHFPAPLNILKAIAYVPSTIFVRSVPEPTYWLGRLPLLDVFSSALFALGIYSFARHLRLDRSWHIAGIFLLGSIWIGLSGRHENIMLVMPFVFIVIAAGINWLLQEWFYVFPRNPIAKTVGNVLVAIAVLITCNYHIIRYFLAWPNTPATKAAFSQKLPKPAK